MDRISEEKKLKAIFGFDKFLDDQWFTIQKIFRGERILLIEKTGFGKSLCYQYPATQFKGVTVIFTPLIALMRDQIRFLQSKKISCAAINSNQPDAENNEIIANALNNKYKILFIAPERQENQDWLNAVGKLLISMVVVDEAHCISVWGHDFRPAYRRIINLVNLLPGNFPVLGTTATATRKVEEDIKKQMGGNVSSIRGKLMRSNFHLRVAIVNSEEEKMIWLGQNINKVSGSGIIYTGTQINTEFYSKWLEFLGIKSAAYNAGLDASVRKEIESGLMNNTYKCVVSTNALGMGIDKPDISFIIHTQIPQSPVHYYQEIGRAGRDGKAVPLVLFYNPYEDHELPHAFIDSARPKKASYEKVIESLRKEILGFNDIAKKVNLKQNQVRVILADLIEQKIVSEVMEGRSRKYEYRYGAPDLDTSFFRELRRQKLRELKDMIDYTETNNCRMLYLCNYLGDEATEKCGKCDNDSNRPIIIDYDTEWKKKLNEFKESFFPLLEVELKSSNLVNGIAGAYYGLTSAGASIHKCKYENGGDYPDYLVRLTLKAFRRHFNGTSFDYILFVPPTESGDLVKNFAVKIARELKIQLSDKLKKSKVTEPQKVFQTGHLKRDNVKNAFYYINPVELAGKSILLIDDIYDSGATMKEIGKYLTSIGAAKIAPLVITKTTGGGYFKKDDNTE
jgi:ATP-dependent DNA helicase RecQ